MNFLNMIYKRHTRYAQTIGVNQEPKLSVRRVEFQQSYPKCWAFLTYNNLLAAGAGGANPGMSLMSLFFGFTICRQNLKLRF